MVDLDYKNNFNLSKKVIIVTGGAGLIGSNILKGIIDLEGIPIVFDNDQNKLKAIKKDEKLKNLKSFNIDLLNEEEIKDSVNNIVNDVGRIDCLINGAAFAMGQLKNSKNNYFEDYENYPRELWSKAINGNLDCIFLMCKIVGSVMRKQGFGRIVNIASDVGVISPDHRIYKPNPKYDYKGVDFNTPASYSVSKSGVIGLTRYLATYWASSGLNVNSVSPAGVFNNHDKKFVEQLAERIPMGRMANVEEVVSPILFLCSEASSFINGANIMIDGGRSIW